MLYMFVSIQIKSLFRVVIKCVCCFETISRRAKEHIPNYFQWTMGELITGHYGGDDPVLERSSLGDNKTT